VILPRETVKAEAALIEELHGMPWAIVAGPDIKMLVTTVVPAMGWPYED
jgi:hypothetical protein